MQPARIVSQDQLSQDLASLKIDRDPKPRSRDRGPSSRGWIVTLVVILGIAALGYFVVYPKIAGSLSNSDVRTAEIQMVSPAQGQVELTATGYVVALVYAKVAAKVPGRIAELFVDEGSNIQKGAPVARLEDVDFKSGLVASRARATAARAKISIARSQLAEVKISIEREKPLVEKGVTAKATYDDLVARAASLQANVRSAEAEALASDAETKSMDTQLGSYMITTPISGTVVQKLVEVGEGVSPGFGTPGVVEVVDMSSLVVEVDVPEVRLSQITEGGSCEVVLDAYPSTRLGCKVKEIGHRINRSKATVPVKVSFDDPPDKRLVKVGADQGKPMKILPDMAARVSFLSKQLDPKSLEQPPKRVVPASAVTQRNGHDVVFVFDDDKLRMVVVELGEPVGSGRELKTVIPEHTKVVLEPSADFADGQRVKEKK
jgi:RND family efflux transporter MFP subunit